MIDIKILLATLEEIKYNSLNFTMDDVARRVKMSKTSLYKYVPSKRELIDELVIGMIERFNKLEQLRAPHQDRILYIATLYISMVSVFNTKTLHDLRRFYTPQWNRWHQFQEEKLEETLTAFQEGVKAGTYAPIHPELLRHILQTLLFDIENVHWLKRSGLTYQEAIIHIKNLLFYGIYK